MASFLDELGMTLFGQNELADYQQTSGSDLLGRAQGLLPQIGSFNQAAAQQQLGLIPIQNQMRAALYGQAINPLQETYNKNILDNLNLGNKLPEDILQQSLQTALQGNAASGFGLSSAGRGSVAERIIRRGEDLGQQRRNEAFGALQAFRAPELRGQLSPTTALDLERRSIDEANFQRSQEAGLRNANRAAIISSLKSYAETGGAVAGEFAGHAFGTSEMGSGAGSILSGMGGSSSGGGLVSGTGGRPDAIRAGRVGSREASSYGF